MSPRDLPPQRPLLNEPNPVALLCPVDNPDGWMRNHAVEAVKNLAILKEDRTKRLIRVSQNASINWDDDHNEDIGRLILAIKRRPFYVVAKLRRTFHGVSWLLGEWDKVRMSVASFGGFNIGTQEMAANLLGVLVEHKSFGLAIEPPADEWPEGMKGKDVWLRAVDQQIDALKGKLPLLETFNTEDKANAINGRPTLADKELNRLERAIKSEEKALLWIAHRSQPHALVDGLSHVSAGRNEANSETLDLEDEESAFAKPAKATKTPRPPFQSPSGPSRPKPSSASPVTQSASPLPPTSASS